MHLQNKCYSFPKRQLVPIPSYANLAMVFICKLFQSRLQVGQFSCMAFPRSCSREYDCGIY